jgi:hypothetical protein
VLQGPPTPPHEAAGLTYDQLRHRRMVCGSDGAAVDCSFQPCDEATRQRLAASPVSLGQLVYGFFRYWRALQPELQV